MKTKIDQKARAFKIWDILKYQAKNRKPITYGELAKKSTFITGLSAFP